MFSEYASRFLAQSQSRISDFIQPANYNEQPTTSLSRPPVRTSRLASRQGLQPSGGFASRYLPQRGAPQGNPYQSVTSNIGLPFTSRYTTRAKEAPLFHSALNEFREDEQGEIDGALEEFLQLQQSRRLFGSQRLEESEESDRSPDRRRHKLRAGKRSEYEWGRGIKSSWHGQSSRSEEARKDTNLSSVHEEDYGVDNRQRERRTGSRDSTAGYMEDVGLESVREDRFSDDDDPPHDLLHESHSSDSLNEPHAFQTFTKPPQRGEIRLQDSPSYSSLSREQPGRLETSHPSSVFSNAPHTRPTASGAELDSSVPGAKTIYHDPFFSTLYLISLTALLATSFLVWLHTVPPTSKLPLGDTIYTVLHSSYHLLAVDTLAAVIVSLLWLACLRSFIRPLVFLAVIGVPVILFSFSLFGLVNSYKGRSNGVSFQDRTMRWLSLLPFLIAVGWTYTLAKGRHSLHKAISILEFASSRILASNPYLLALGLGLLATTIAWTWIWLSMFTRVFLSGHFSSSRFFILDVTTWWLGAAYVCMYLWTLSILSGVQRVVSGAAVSEWYFHRHRLPASPSPSGASSASEKGCTVILAGLLHAGTGQLGTICLSSLLALLIRLPILVLPKRVMAVLALGVHSLIPSPILGLISPLTLTYAGIQSQDLASSARALNQMRFFTSATDTLSPGGADGPGPRAEADADLRLRGGYTATSPRRVAYAHNAAPLLPYRLAKLLLYSTRCIMAISLGFGAWAYVAHSLPLDSGIVGGIRGSTYAYVVGLLAAVIGWGVLGCMEGVMVGVLDAVVVCWGIERGAGGQGAVYCREAEVLFGGGVERGDEEGRGLGGFW